MANELTEGGLSRHQPKDNLRALCYLLLGFFLFASADTMVKFLTGSMHPIQIVWFRQMGLVLVALVLLARQGPGLLRTAHPYLQITRGSLAAISAIFFVFAVKYVPLADVVAVTFVAPFLVTVLGAIFLREHVSRARWVAVGLGFVGAMIVIRPGLGVFHPAIFLILVASVAFAMRQILSRSLAASDKTVTTLSYTAVASCLLLTIPLLFVWQRPESGQTYVLLAAVALLAATGEILVIRAFQMAEAVVVAPTHYSLMIWATFYGWFVFGQLPDQWTWVGTGVIFATGIYLIRMERASLRFTKL